MYKKELERKQKEEQEATALAFEEFIKTFQDVSGPPSKLFVKSGVLNGRSGKEEDSEKGTIYKPSISSRSSAYTLRNAIECACLLKETRVERSRNSEKPKSNLEQLKEELRARHLERNEKYKMDDSASNFSFFENADQNTTNLFVANMNPKMTEQDLIKIFGNFGPLASVKIMWPRNEEKGRTNCGFVAYMSRKDGERALVELKNRDDMRIGWGKPVELPAHPIFIPHELLKILLPPPYTGLPFNAQPLKQPFEYPKTDTEMRELLFNSVVKVTIPLDKKVLMTIHRVIEFVVTEGPLFEAIVMNKEINNPLFQFLFDNKCPSHVYYRWKLYSILKGESINSWSSGEFRMFKGGSVWVPPVIPDYSQGMPENLIKIQEKALLSDAQRNRLIQYIHNMTLSRGKIGEAMVFCLNHSDASKTIVDILADSFKNSATKAIKKIARLYLISDILRNSASKKNDNYRIHFTKQMETIMENLKKTLDNLKLLGDKDAYKIRVSKVLRAWDLWKIFTADFLNKLETIFNGVEAETPGDDSDNDEPLDGNNLIKRLRNEQTIVGKVDNCVILKTPTDPLPGFIPSKWETVAPEQVEAEAMSTKKFYDFEIETYKKLEKTRNVDREKLRRIEVAVVKYQDELESGKRKLKNAFTIEQQLNHYRKHLIARMKKENERSRTSSPFTSDSASADEHNKMPKIKKTKKRMTRSHREKNRKRK